jgi:hypothetical protein
MAAAALLLVARTQAGAGRQVLAPRSGAIPPECMDAGIYLQVRRRKRVKRKAE